MQEGLGKKAWLPGLVWMVFLLLFAQVAPINAQTKGLIYQSAEGPGRLILDPNSDGFVSSTTGGFSANDVTESELSMFALPILEQEPLNDVRTGAKGGHTDIASLGSTYASGAYMFYDGTNVIFRVRLADQSTASKGYSFFFNTDFSAFGPKASGFTSSNPGFQFEVVLETGKGISIYTLSGDNATLAKTLTEDEHFQKSLSFTISDGSTTGHFYDFYVPISELESAVSGFSASTGFRAAMATITRAQSGITGTLSDINGVNDNNYKDATQALVDIIEATPSTSINDIDSDGGGFGNSETDIPSIDIPLVAGDTEIKGTSIEADGTTVTVYVNGSSVGTASVSDNTWSLTYSTGLSADDVVKVSADATDKDASSQSDGVTVLAANQQCTDDPINVAQGGNTLSGTITGLPSGLSSSHLQSNVVIRVYRGSDVFVSTDSGDPGTDGYVGFNSFSFNSTTGNYDFELDNGSGGSGPGGNPYNDENFSITAQYQTQCESNPVVDGLTNVVNSETPVITTTTITESTTSVSGTSNSAGGASIFLYHDREQIGTTTAGSSGDWTVSGIASNTFVDGKEVFARAVDATTDAQFSSNSNTVIVGSGALEQSEPPKILGSYLTTSTTISGTTVEGPGTVIRVLVDGFTLDQTTSDAFGNWEVTGVDLSNDAGNDITATAKAEGEAVSDPSSAVTIQSAQTSAPVIESGATTLKVSGFSDNISITSGGGTTNRIYIDGDLVLETSSTSISFSTTSNDNSTTIGDLIEPGVEVYATAQNSSEIESDPSNVITVLADPVRYISVTSLSPNPAASGGDQDVTITYRVLDSSFSEESGVAVDLSSSGGSGSLSASQLTTDTDGEVSPVYTTAASDDGKTVEVTAQDADKQSDPYTASFNVLDPPELSSVNLGDDGSGNLSLSFVSDKQLGGSSGDIKVTVDGPSSGSDWVSFDRDDFSESGSGPYTYTLSTTQSYSDGNGTYTAVIDDAKDSDGTDGADGSDQDTFAKITDDTAPASVTLVSPSSTTVRASSGSGNVQSLQVSYSYSETNPSEATITFDDGSNTASFTIDDSGYAGDGTTKSETLDLSNPDATTGSGFVDGNTYDISVEATDVKDNSATDTETDLLAIDNTAPSVSSATVDGTSLVITYDETLDDASTPAASAFSVDGSSTGTQEPSSVDVSGSKVTLTLGTGVSFGETVSVDYTVPGSGKIQDDGAENDASALSDRSVTNNTADATDPEGSVSDPSDGEEVKAQDTITGSSTDNDAVASVAIKIQRSSDSKYWTGSGWQSGSTTVNTSATDGDFNSGNEDWSYDASGITAEDTYTVTVTVTDDTGNSANSSSVSYTIDTTSPTVDIQDEPDSVTDTDPFSVTFEFSESVSGFASGDVTLGNASISNFSSTDGNTYTADITPDGNGDVTIDVAADVATDDAGNGNTAASQASTTVSLSNPSKLVFTGQPANTTAGETMSDLVVEVRDDSDAAETTDPDDSATEQITLTLTDNTEGATLQGTKTADIDWGTGQATFSDLTIEETGSYTLTAGTGISGVSDKGSDSFDITAASATGFTISGSATQTAGTSQEITITAVDAFGNTATAYTGDHTLTFSGAGTAPDGTSPAAENKDGSTIDFGNGTVLNFTNGTVSADITLFKVETASVAISDGSISQNSTLDVTIEAGALETFAWNLSDPQVNKKAFTGTNTLTAQDSWENTIEDFDASAANVTITNSLNGTVTGLGSGDDNVLNRSSDFSSGVADLSDQGFTYDGELGTGTFTATTNSKSGTSSSIEIQEGTPGAITASPATITADGSDTSTLTVQLKNNDGTNQTTGGSTVTLSADKGSIGTVTDNGDGTYTAVYTAGTSTGKATITGTADGISISDNATITLVAGDASAAKSTIAVSPATIVADGDSASVVTITLKDSQGNQLTSGGDTVVLSSTLGTLKGTSDNGDGTYSDTLRSTVTGTAKLTAKLNGNELAQSEEVEVVAGELSLSNTLLTISPDTIVADNDSASVITVTLKDKNDNTITSGSHTVTLGSTLGSLKGVVDAGEGVFRDTLRSSDIGTAEIAVEIDGQEKSETAQVTTVSGDPYKLVMVDGDKQTGEVGKPVENPIKVKVQDKFENPVEGATLAFSVDETPEGAVDLKINKQRTSTDSSGIGSSLVTLGDTPGTYRISVGSGNLEPVIFDITANTGGVSKISKLSGDKQVQSTLSTLRDSLSVQLFDRFDNPVVGQQVQFRVVDAPNKSNGFEFTPDTSSSDDNGIAYRHFKLGSEGGEYEIAAFVENFKDTVRFTQTAIDSRPDPSFIDTVNTVVFNGNPSAFLFAEPSSTLDNLQDMTVEIWMLPDSLTESYTIAEKGQQGNNAGSQFRIWGKDNTVIVDLFNAAGERVRMEVDSFFVEKGDQTGGSLLGSKAKSRRKQLSKKEFQWAHLAVSVDTRSGQATLLRNGFKIRETGFSGNLNKANQRMKMGNGYSGEIHEVRIWEEPTSQTDIQSRMTQILSGKEENLVLYHTFDDKDDKSDKDLTPNGNTLFLSEDVERNFSIRGLPDIELNEDENFITIFKGLDENGNRLNTIITRLPAHGKLFQVSDNGRVTGEEITSVPTKLTDSENRALYQPDQYFFGEDSLGYKLQDPLGNEAEAPRFITVHPVNNAPEVVFGENRNVVFDQRDTLVVELKEFVNDVDNSFPELRWEVQMLSTGITQSAVAGRAQPGTTGTGSDKDADDGWGTGEQTHRRIAEDDESMRDGDDDRSEGWSSYGELKYRIRKPGNSLTPAGHRIQSTLVQSSSGTARRDSLVVSIDQQNDRLILTTTPRFTAKNIRLLVKAFDLDRAAGEDTLVVSVNPVNDPPAPFEQLLPADRDTTELSDLQPAITLNWEASTDIEGDDITYLLRIKRADGEERLFDSLEDTTHSVSRDDPFVQLDQSYNWKVWATDGVDTTSSVEDKELFVTKKIPLKYHLLPNYPNPFNPVTTIEYWVPIDSQVEIKLYNILGRRISTLVNRQENRGLHAFTLNADQLGLASGVYFYRMVAEGLNPKLRFVKTRKLILIK